MCEQYQIMYQTPITILRFSWVHDQDDILAHVTLGKPNLGVPVWPDWATTAEQKAYFDEGKDGVACLVHADGRAGKRQIVSLKDVVQSIMCAVGNQTAVGEAFNVSGPAAFAYDVLANYVAEKLDLPVVKFEVGEFHDFCIDMSKSRSVLGFDPQYDIFRIVDDALQFRKEGKTRTECLYPG
jgi:UDP-glucose 4-epimerase